ncbi:Uncharacterised protein [uncultured archaeon]|nr:Uncharacterised protein [uncultured archaeon]
MALTPWHKSATPREDLRKGKPMDAAEFAVNLDRVRDGKAPDDYKDPKQFFERTYLTKNLTALAAEVQRRFSGERTETSAVFNMATQFGGGKTHALTLLYHLARNGPAANGWLGVNKILTKAGIDSVQEAATAVFVGTEFDSITGKGGNGEPLRKTPWGEIAYQLSGNQGFAVVEEHDKKKIAPGGDVIRSFLPKDRPCLILMDELMNYISRNRESGLSDQLYNFIQNLTNVASGEDRVVLVVSIPGSQMEMNEADFSEYNSFKKIMDKHGKAVMISAEAETSEIIRRRLFEWGPDEISPDGKIQLSTEAKKTCKSYANWVKAHKNQVPGWFPVDHAEEVFEATYPFHPMVLSVFETKWQSLPRFQRTRGILRLLALWVSKVYQENYTGAYSDALIGLGTAPLDDPIFRAAIFEQLGEDLLEGSVTTDIAGKKEAHAVRLDNEASSSIKKARLHRKVATVILFESNGGQTHGTKATLPEIRLAVAEPDLDIGNIETVLDNLTRDCYYLEADGTSYKFGLQIQLPKIHADRKASIARPEIDECIRNVIIKVFNEGNILKSVFFPEKSGDIQDNPALTLIVLSPDHRRQDKVTIDLVESMTKDHGTSARTYKSALIWSMADNDSELTGEARNALAWEKIHDEADQLHLDEKQKSKVNEKIGKANRDLREAVWRSYKNLALLGKDNRIFLIDLGLIHSSAAKTLVDLYLLQLRQKDLITTSISPNFLVKNWPPAFLDWSTKSVRDAFFASPLFPRLLNSEAVKETISKGASNGIFAYVGKAETGEYDPIYYNTCLLSGDVEISDDWFIVKKPISQEPHVIELSPSQTSIKPGDEVQFAARGLSEQGQEVKIDALDWSATGGTIDGLGVFKAGINEGTFSVYATAGKVKGSAFVTIRALGRPLKRVVVYPQDAHIGPGKTQTFAAKGLDEDDLEVLLDKTDWSATGGIIDDKGIFQAGPEEGTFKVTATVGDANGSATLTIKKLSPHWDGEIPHQKWTQFYNRILSKFAVRKGLKLMVAVDILDASEEEIEEIRAALRDLGLGDDVEVK